MNIEKLSFHLPRPLKKSNTKQKFDNMCPRQRKEDSEKRKLQFIKNEHWKTIVSFTQTTKKK